MTRLICNPLALERQVVGIDWTLHWRDRNRDGSGIRRPSVELRHRPNSAIFVHPVILGCPLVEQPAR